MKLKQIKRPWWIKKAPWFAIIILSIFIFIAVFAETLAPYPTNVMDLSNRLAPPGSEGHILGTDTLGHDVLSRVIYGGRVSLLVTLLVLTLSGTIGLTVGIVAGYLGGKVDNILMRIVDVFLSFPPILIAIIFAVTMGPGLHTIVLAISFTYWARFTRSIRAQVLQIKGEEYIALAKVAGCSPLYIMFKHVLPNVFDVFVVLATLQIGLVIVLESSLSFLGAGLPPTLPSWGQLVGSGRDYIDSAWWITIIPGIALAIVVLSFNLFGDWLRDVTDPKLRAVMSVDDHRGGYRWCSRLLSRLQRRTNVASKNRGM